MHGDLALPTPQSVGLFRGGDVESARFRWREEGVDLTKSGMLSLPQHAWMADIAAAVAEGDFQSLADDMMRYVDSWDRDGRLSWRPEPDADTSHPITGRTRSELASERNAGEPTMGDRATLAPPDTSLLLRGLLLPNE